MRPEPHQRICFISKGKYSKGPSRNELNLAIVEYLCNGGVIKRISTGIAGDPIMHSCRKHPEHRPERYIDEEKYEEFYNIHAKY